MSLVAVTPAWAQTADVAPPARYALDANGVNLATGTFVVDQTAVSIGPAGPEGLAYTVRQGPRLKLISNYSQALYQNGTSWSAATGFTSRTFNQSGTTFTSTDGSGASLVQSGTGSTATWTLIEPDGTQVVYGYRTRDAGDTTLVARGTSIVHPSGVRTTLTWVSGQICTTYYDNCSPGQVKTRVRLQSVTNSQGYQLHLDYSGDSTEPDWTQLSSVTAINNAVDYCDPTAATCTGLTQSWPTGAAGRTPVINWTGGVTDPLGRKTTYQQNGATFTIQRPSSSGVNTTVTTDANNRVASITTDGRTWGYAFSPSGNLMTATITNPDQTTRTVVSDTVVGLPVSVTDELNRTITYHYDPNGRLDLATAPEGNAVKYGYDARGNIIETRVVSKTPGTPADIVTSAGYDATCTNPVKCNSPNWTRDANGAQTDYTYDQTMGGLLTVTAPAPTSGATRPQVRYRYSPLQAYAKNASGAIVASGATVYRLTSISTCRTQASCAGTADEVKTAVSYGPQAAGQANNLLPVSTTTGAGDGSVTATASVSYDPIGNIQTATDPLGDVNRSVYDAARELTMTIGPDPDGAGPLKNRAASLHYTPDGLVDQQAVGTANPDGSGFVALQVAATGYDTSNRPVRAETRDGSGNVYSVAQTSYDAKGRPLCTAVRMDPSQWASQADACTPQTSAAAGPDRITRNSYTAADEVQKATSAYGTTDQADEATYSYSRNGKLATVTDANGNVTSYGYDAFDRLSTTTYPGGSYEQLGYDANSNVISRRLRDGQVIGYGYDALNRLTGKDRPNAVYWETDTGYGYDLLGHMTGAWDSNGHSLSFGYDALGRKTSQGDNWYAFGNASFSYDPAGRRTRLTWNDGFFVTYDYDATGAMTAVRENGGAALASFGYDDLGRRTILSRANGTSTTYAYDPASRLTGLSLNGGNVPNGYTFGYNAAGQITSRTSSNDLYTWTGAVNVDRGYGVNGLNQYTSSGGVALGYDGRGNLTSSGGSGYGYTVDNQLATAPGANLAYDPVGRLFNINSENGTNVTLTSDGADLLAETNQNTGALLRRYVYGPGTDEPLVWYEGAGAADKRYLHADERGSIVAVTDGAGNALNIKAYDEYGIPQDSNPAYQGRFGYTGQAWLPSVGLSYYKARVYSPTLGRFMQTDPIGYADGMNWYNYIHSDPVNGTDPSGTCPKGFQLDHVFASLMMKCAREDGGGGSGGSSGSGGGGGSGGDGGSAGYSDSGPGWYHQRVQYSDGTYGQWSPPYWKDGNGAGLFAAIGGAAGVPGNRSEPQKGDQTPQPGDVVVTGQRLAQEIIPPIPELFRFFFEQPPVEPLPPGWDETWTWGRSTQRPSDPNPRWFDPRGGEWRYHGPDKYHEPHWDYHPNTNPRAPWQRIPITPSVGPFGPTVA